MRRHPQANYDDQIERKEDLLRIPVIHGVIDRRLLVNFRVDAEVLAKALPAPFRPKLHNGHGVAGICLIRLRALRPRIVPAACGIGSENAAHRIAVEWDTPEGPVEGVFIPRRDTSSRLNTLLGGRLFPGEHHLASFRCRESEHRLEIAMRSRDGEAELSVSGDVTHEMPQGSIFQSREVASQFFQRGSLGYSVTAKPAMFDGLELRTMDWSVSPVRINHVHSSFFADKSRFPAGAVEFDCALLMKDVVHEWHSREPLCCDATAGCRALEPRPRK